MGGDVYRFQLGSYWLFLPHTGELTAQVRMPSSLERLKELAKATGNSNLREFQMAFPRWQFDLDRFYFTIWLGPGTLGDLKREIDSQTKGDVVTPSVEVNGIPGVTFGSYEAPRTRIDWLFKKGDTMIRLSLLSHEVPVAEPTDAELEQHDEQLAKLVKLRFFAGLTHQQAAEVLGISRRTADRLWKLARAWLFRQLSSD